MRHMIYLQPMGSVDSHVLCFLKTALASIRSVEMLDPIDIPNYAWDKTRYQYEGSALLDSMPVGEGVTLGVTEVDAYVEGLNFIFGLAYDRKALISIKRLRPEFYGLPQDEDLLNNRALKEAVHELGHVFKLKHCPNKRCVMHFSNAILDTDLKDWEFCESCERNIKI